MKLILKTLTILFIFLMNNVSSQEIDSLVFANISQQLVDNYLEDYYPNDENMERRGNCVYDKKEEFTLSCIYTQWDMDWATDFDGDLINDIIVRLTDAGLGGGGNAFGYDFNIITLDKNNNIKDIYTLYGGGKMSYAHLSIDKVDNGRIYATYEQNPYGYGFQEVTFDNKEQVNLEFSIEDSKLLEKNYPKCPIAEMNKNIFKDDLNFEINRSVSLDALFHIKQEERLFLKDNTHYYATLSGCEDIDLYFTHTIPYKESLESDRGKIKDIWLEHVAFLKTNSRYKTVFNELYTKLSHLETKDVELQEYGGASNEFMLNKNWQASVFTSGNEEQGSFVTVSLTKSTNTEPRSFWETMKEKATNSDK